MFKVPQLVKDKAVTEKGKDSNPVLSVSLARILFTASNHLIPSGGVAPEKIEQ